MFEAQLETMVTWFDQWNETGQTAALFTMVKRLSPVPAKFFSNAMLHSLNNFAELALQEQEANNPGFVSSLLTETKDVAMAQLLLHLPLLHPGNMEAKRTYLVLLPTLFSYSMDTGYYMEEARQLLAYVLIHPALKEERKNFERWRRLLSDKIINGNKILSVSTQLPSPQPSFKNVASQQKIRRSNSLTQSFGGVTQPNEPGTSQDDMSVVRGKNRRFSLSEHSGGPTLTPQSSPQGSSGSGSDVHLEDSSKNFEPAPGMKDVKYWLKSLRLHKYSKLFYQMTYDQMLSLNEDTFDHTLAMIDTDTTVTEGARRKILLSISKLRDRYSNLCQLGEDVMNATGGNLSETIDELKAILATPIKKNCEDDRPPVDDIPSQFTTVLGKVCTQIMVCGRGDEEVRSYFLSLLDSTLKHEAFTPQQKGKITNWRQRLQAPQPLKNMWSDPNRFQSQSLFLQPANPGLAVFPPFIPQYPIQQYQQQPAIVSIPQAPRSYHRNSLSVATAPGPSSASMFLAKRPSLQDGPQMDDNHASVQRTQSAPPNPPSSTPITCANTVSETDPELNSRLESLCLRMTEQALSGGSEL